MSQIPEIVAEWDISNEDVTTELRCRRFLEETMFPGRLPPVLPHQLTSIDMHTRSSSVNQHRQLFICRFSRIEMNSIQPQVGDELVQLQMAGRERRRPRGLRRQRNIYGVVLDMGTPRKLHVHA